MCCCSFCCCLLLRSSKNNKRNNIKENHLFIWKLYFSALCFGVLRCGNLLFILLKIRFNLRVFSIFVSGFFGALESFWCILIPILYAVENNTYLCISMYFMFMYIHKKKKLNLSSLLRQRYYYPILCYFC